MEKCRQLFSGLLLYSRQGDKIKTILSQDGEKASLHGKGKEPEIREKLIHKSGENCQCHAFEKVITDRSWWTNGGLSRQLLHGSRREDRENTNTDEECAGVSIWGLYPPLTS